MKKLLHILFLLTALINFAYAQENLVPNPSFEEYSDCPQGAANFYVHNWFSIFGGTPDYYNSCNNTLGCWGAGVPCNIAGFQNAKEGNGYIGIATYVADTVWSLREWAGTQLTGQLERGTTYFVSMYVALSYSEENGNTLCCSSNNIGFRFSSSIPNSSHNPDNIAQVYSSVIVSDTVNWTRVSGSFIADSNYRYLIIGNFFDNEQTDAICCNTASASAYYYIDAITVSTDSTVGINIGVLNSEKNAAYPNPANNTIYLNKQGGTTIDYLIVDAMGKTVQSENNYSVNQINVENIPNGIYFLYMNGKAIKKISIFHNN